MIGDKRDKKGIKKWMIDAELRQVDIMKATEESQQLVNMTINGRRNRRNVLRYLIDKGCPVELLDLPMDMTEAA